MGHIAALVVASFLGNCIPAENLLLDLHLMYLFAGITLPFAVKCHA